ALRSDSEDSQDIAGTAMVEAAVAHAAADSRAVLRQARQALSVAGGIGMKSDTMRWSWTLASAAARTLGDTDALQQLITMVDEHPAGGIPPTTRAGADLAKIHLGAVDPVVTAEIVDSAITTLR